MAETREDSRGIWAARALLPEGWAGPVRLTLAGGRIAALGAAAAPGPGDTAAEILVPSPGNLHSHAFQRAMAGLTERRGTGTDSFWTWRELMYRFLGRITPEQVEAIAAQLYVEMLEAGFARVGEFHYLHHGPDGAEYAMPGEMGRRIAAAAEATGIGLTLLPVLYMQGGADGRALAGGQRRFGCDPAGFARLLEDLAAALQGAPEDWRLGVAPHSLRAVPPAALAEAVALRPEAPVHMHIAEQVAEVAEIEAAHGARPVEWALENLGLDARWCLIHATQMTPAETDGLAASGAVAGLCPITEANLGDGIFDGARFLAAGGAFGVGSDSNIRIGLAEELRQLEHSQRLRDRARAVLAEPGGSVGRRLYEGAARGSARALGQPQGGRIAPGAPADLVALDASALCLAAREGDALLDGWIFAGDDRAVVREVWSAGRHVVQAGHHLAREAVAARYRRALGELLAG
ncbi:formimidoylglutamate deiminase [Paralimibaculum aggregatum]|uniref:Formimidoylglutamate deiminase n=1 Tax=Paralimibaculum aggregatum TaxID=3036245 RepID=A0ABQ6LTA7_9RHOB|nr:formimidoylglutamate deiminase [Limibaculum sp. NKW23]GMG85330.1 formimidoylglutamate deiminase [Limibaculum sp. NKW23]